VRASQISTFAPVRSCQIGKLADDTDQQVSTIAKSAVSPARQQLIVLLQNANFGSVQVRLSNSEPLFAPPPTVTRTIKLGKAENGTRPEARQLDFALKARLVELFEHFDRIQNGTVTIRVQHGLPTQVTVERQP
jgi:hypothetical protein